MISSRGLLLRQLQQFFEVHVGALFPWGKVQHRPAELHEKKIGRRQLKKEVAVVEFGGYALSISSPDEAPPLGAIILYDTRSDVKIEGVVDEATWARIGEHIRQHPPSQLKEDHYVDDRRQLTQPEV